MRTQISASQGLTIVLETSPTAATRQPVLAGISHGTSSATGQALVSALTDKVRAKAEKDARTGVVTLGHVDVQQPDISATLETLGPGDSAVLVPLLLSAGFHVNIDMKEAIDTAEGGHPVVIAPALGPDERLARILEKRAIKAGADPQKDIIILAAAGSSDTSAVRDVATMAEMFSQLIGTTVIPAYLTFADPTITAAIEEAQQRSPGARIVVVSYLLAPGYFQNLLESRARKNGVKTVTQPLLFMRRKKTQIPQELPDIILDRYHQGCQDLHRLG